MDVLNGREVARQKKYDLSAKKRNELIFYTLIMALPVVQVLIFYFAVNFNSIILAFKEYNYGLDGEVAGYTWIGFANFEKAFRGLRDEYALQASLRNSLSAFFVQLCVSTPLALVFSYYIFQKKTGSGLFRIFLFLPAVISPLVIVILFKVMLEEALPAYILKLFSKTIAPIYSTHTQFALLFYFVWTGFGTNVLMYTSAMTGIDESVMEASRLDGAEGIKGFWYIVLPLIYPTLMTFITVSMATIFTNQLNLFSFENASAEKKYYTYGYYLYVKTATGTLGDYPFLSALGLVFTCIAVPITLLTRKLMTKFGPKVY